MTFDFTVKEFILGDGTPTFQFYSRGFNLGGSGSQPAWRNVILSGNTALTLTDAKANGLNYVNVFGGCEQSETPTPTVPVDIVCNNGTLSFPQSAVGTVTQSGTPTPNTPVEPVFYKKGNLVLRAIGTNTDSYNSTNQTITRKIGYYIFDGTETFGTSTAYGTALYVNGVSVTWGADRSKDVLCQYFTGASDPSGVMPENSCFFNASGHFYFRTNESSADFKAWLAELYDNGTPLIVWFVKGSSATESFTPSLYIDGTTETIEVDTTGDTATAEMLLSVGDYTDMQEVLTGAITRNLGIKVLDGTEEGWAKSNNSFSNSQICPDKVDAKKPMLCTHFAYNTGTTTTITDLKFGCSVNGTNVFFRYDNISTLEDWQTWLTNQYKAGTPVIIVYPLATATHESVTAQPLTIQAGTNVIEITQASINDLELEVSYKEII